MTTDLYPKVRRVELGGGSIVGFAKGAGMIEPDLATMLVYLLTDLDVPREALRSMLPAVMGPTFNAISIDSDQSTSDTVAVVSSRRVPCDDVRVFASALAEVCVLLAEDVVRNGEGVHHVIRCRVSGAPDVETARGVGKSVVNSPLVQCAICGNDANVGRLIMAVGKFCGAHGIELDASRLLISVAGIEVFSGGAFLLDPGVDARLTERLRHAAMYSSAPPDARGVFRPPIDFPPHERVVDLDVDLGLGSAAFSVLGADRSHEYISENADYRS
jgi:glutamate N-acetyltransferase/amino-acid N-acetyltransferase